MAAEGVREDIFMAKLLTLDILFGYSRPVIQLTKDITCLIDTGAVKGIFSTNSLTINISRWSDSFTQ